MESTLNPVKVTLYRWAGSWGPFKVNIPCGECSLTVDVIEDTFKTELAGIPVELETFDWLSNWWKPLPKRGWHAPIVMVDTHVFGKETCPHCVRAKGYLDDANIPFKYHDVVKEPRALYEMLGRVKPIVGPKTPITVPQVWVDGKYVGGADEMEKLVNSNVEPNPDRGQCSLSPTRT